MAYRHKCDKDYPMAKHGSKANGTHSAHILSHEVGANLAKGTAPTRKDAAIYNGSANTRIKSSHGNLSTDRRQDGQIIQAAKTGQPLTNKATFQRAKKQYAIASQSNSSHMRNVQTGLAKVKYANGKAGRNPSAASRR